MRLQSQTLNIEHGKYDTYKGSTQVASSSYFLNICSAGNMILIKDRHWVFIR